MAWGCQQSAETQNGNAGYEQDHDCDDQRREGHKNRAGQERNLSRLRRLPPLQPNAESCEEDCRNQSDDPAHHSGKFVVDRCDGQHRDDAGKDRKINEAEVPPNGAPIDDETQGNHGNDQSRMLSGAPSWRRYRSATLAQLKHFKPNHIGVPTAPKLGIALKIRHSKATRTGGNPSPTRMGAASAAGVPRPQAPSMRKTNAQPTSMSCATGLLEMPRRHSRSLSLLPIFPMPQKENGAKNDRNRGQGFEKSGDNSGAKEGGAVPE